MKDLLWELMIYFGPIFGFFGVLILCELGGIFKIIGITFMSIFLIFITMTAMLSDNA